MDSVTQVFERILATLGGPRAPTLAAQQAAWSTLKSQLGRRDAAAKLGLNESELSAFEQTLSDVQRWSQAPEGPRRDDFLRLASLATLQWLERIAQHVGVEAPALTTPFTEERCASAVRALELVLRELIQESYRTQGALTSRLQHLFKPEQLARWQRAGGNDVLNGLSFGELASFFVSKDEYPRYQPLLEVGDFLAMLRERRKTLRTYLDSLRLVRNSLAHHKPLTTVQRALVEAYTKEIFSPLDLSWREGRTTINPENFLAPTTEGLREWVDGLADDVREVQDELASLRDDVASTKQAVGALEGGLVLVLLSGFFFLFTIGVTAADVLLTPQTEVPDLARAALQATRSLRGLTAAGLTFLLAVLRVVLNLTVFQRGAGGPMRGWLSGTRGRTLFAGWALAGLALFFAPIHVAAIDAPVQQLNFQLAFLNLDERAIDTYFEQGGDPNAVVYGNSLLRQALLAQALKLDGGQGLDDEKRARVLRLLVAKGAVISQADRDFAKVMGREHLLPGADAGR